MTLLITLVAAVASTFAWYLTALKTDLKLEVLCWLYWGASLMWLVDAVLEYAELGAAYFRPDPLDMLNDAYLGLSAVVLGLVIWIVILLAKDPQGTIRARLLMKK